MKVSPKNKCAYNIERLASELDTTERVDGLSTDAQTVIELLNLVVEIKYRRKYGEVIEYQRGKGYSNNIKDEVLAGPLSPVDDALPGA